MAAGTDQVIVYLILRQVVFRRENIFLLRVFHRITLESLKQHRNKFRTVAIPIAISFRYFFCRFGIRICYCNHFFAVVQHILKSLHNTWITG